MNERTRLRWRRSNELKRRMENNSVRASHKGERQEIVFTFNVLVFKQILTSSRCLHAARPPARSLACYVLHCEWLSKYFIYKWWFFLFSACCFVLLSQSSSKRVSLASSDECISHLNLSHCRLFVDDTHLLKNSILASSCLLLIVVPPVNTQVQALDEWATFVRNFRFKVQVGGLPTYLARVELHLRIMKFLLPWNVRLPKKFCFIRQCSPERLRARGQKIKNVVAFDSVLFFLFLIIGKKSFNGRPGSQTRAAY